MPWARLDDHFHTHPKVNQAGLEALGLYTVALAYCAHYLTDGKVDQAFVEQKAGRRARQLCERLVDAGLWERNGDGFLVHDYLKYNESRKSVLLRRAKDSGRKAA